MDRCPANKEHVPEMSDSGTLGSEERLVNGPESRHVVDAVDALLVNDLARARTALEQAADVVGWDAVAHRLDVVGRALAGDAGVGPQAVPPEVDLVPSILATTITEPTVDAPRVLDRWQAGEDTAAATIDDVWPSLAVVAWLVDTAGFPAEVVV